MFNHVDFDGHEKVLMVEDYESGLKAIIALHSTALGPAAGGCRLWSYESDTAALSDALRLSRGMSYKNAMANLKMGGGKAVILGPVAPTSRQGVFEAFGRAVESLDGQYITAEDVGVSVTDMMTISRTTGYVSGIAGAEGRSGGDPSPYTARGVRVGIEAAVRAKLGRSDLAGLKVAIQGLGHVGTFLCEELFNLGARLYVADINPERVSDCCDRFAAEPCSVDDILKQTVDVVAPCALGGAIDDEVAQYLQATIVAGAANNQLKSASAGHWLAKRGILYAPDYVINAGGIIMVAGEISGDNDEVHIGEQVTAIGPRLADIFARAKSTDRPTFEVADSLAREKIGNAIKARRKFAEIA